MDGKKTKLAIGVITRERPTSFGQLLESFVSLQVPENVEPVYVLVENRHLPTLAEQIVAFRAEIGRAEVIYEHEPILGIPYARNRVLDLASRHACEWLAFIDDDEIADECWLVELVGELQRRRLDLVGGPVRIRPCPEDANALERAIWRGLTQRSVRGEAAALRRHRRGTDHRVAIATGNWFADLGFIRRHGLHFDETLGFSGGSDARFFRQAQAAGARTGWAPEAHVYEGWQRARLHFGYQYRRGRDQAIAAFRIKHSACTPVTFLKSVGFILFKAISFVFLLVITFLDGGCSSVPALRALGFAVGRAQALAGGRSNHYAEVQSG